MQNIATVPNKIEDQNYEINEADLKNPIKSGIAMRLKQPSSVWQSSTLGGEISTTIGSSVRV